MSESSNLDLVQSCFSSNWSIYQQIRQFNYMEHQEIYDGIKQYIVKHYPSPFSVLELGCGDAVYSAQTLEGTAIQSYTGVDLAATGLDLAAFSLNRLNCSVELKQQEMQEFLEGCSSTFDLILVSFTLHHLSAAEKQLFLQECSHRLNHGGSLLLIDVFRRENESRSQYLSRYCNHIETQWQKLPPQSIAKVTEHIRNSDLPESEATLRLWATEIGFNQLERIYSGIQEVHKAFALSKASVSQ